MADISIDADDTVLDAGGGAAEGAAGGAIDAAAVSAAGVSPKLVLDSLETAFDALADGIVVIQDNRIMIANRAFRKLAQVGSSDGQAGAMGLFSDWVEGRDMAAVTKYLDACMDAAKDLTPVEFRVLDSRGRAVWVRAEGQVVSYQGAPATVLTVIDIGRFQRHAGLPAESLEIFREIFNLSHDLMAIIDRSDGTIIDVNPAFLNTFGRRREDVIGCTTEALNIWSEPVFFSRFMQEMKINASMSDVPTVVRTRGNVIRHFHLAAQKIDGASRALMLMIGRDVTDMLSDTIDMQRSRDEADIANRAKSEFLANMSHELRTPLNAILGFAEIIRDEHLGEIGIRKYREYAADIHHSGSHLLSIIKDILDLSKVESGRLDASFTWIDPTDSLSMCASLISRRAKENKITVVTEIDDSLQIEADERLIKQVAINLLSNSVKFNREGGRIVLRFIQTPDGGARLSVADTGVGMTADEVRIAKRPFGQVQRGGGGQEGSGLGLPLVMSFCEKLGATMGIQSTPTVGTTVQVTFPPHKTRKFVEDSDDDADDMFLI